MRYVIARYRQKQRDDAYRIYLSDGIRMITESAAMTASGGMSGGETEVYYLGVRYEDLYRPKPEIKPGEAKKRIIDKFRS